MAGTLNDFIDEDLSLDGAPGGRLSGKTFAAKDLYDIAGMVSICGNPDWGRTHPPAGRHAEAVQQLLNAGADLRGKTITDEFAFSIVGENHHHGTPVNPNAQGRTCGGSSSGSAAAVAGGLVDFALGTDTGGSVRVPASFCGIHGLRPTHGRASLAGVFPLAPSFDTAGWFSRSAATMRSVGSVLLSDFQESVPTLTRFVYAEDAWALAEPETVAALTPAIQGIEEAHGPMSRVQLTQNQDLADWFDVFRVAQGAEIWATLGPWITETQPDIGPGVRERLQWCASISAEERSDADAARNRIAQRVADLTEGDAVLVLPITPGAALEAGKSAVQSNEVRARLIQLSGIAPLCRTPQLSMPVGRHPDGPVALSLMAARGMDEALLSFAASCCGEAIEGVSQFEVGY